MNSQDFLTLNLVGAGAFIFWYVVSRGGLRRPTQLNLKTKDSAPPLINPVYDKSFSENPPSSATQAPILYASKEKTTPSVHPDLSAVKSKCLNVMFNYNGHSWDAYEVLGVPAGASIKTVTEAYQVSLRRNSPSSMEFLEAAYKAILNKAS